MIDLYTSATPNGHKASITLEELEASLRGPFPSTSAPGTRSNPNFSPSTRTGGFRPLWTGEAGDFPIFESGAIMIYLAEKAGQLLPTDAKGRSQVIQWLRFQMGGIGPMMGQANVFSRYFPEKIPSAIARYRNETRRLLEVVDRHLADREWLAGEFSIADIANWAWIRTHKWSGGLD